MHMTTASDMPGVRILVATATYNEIENLPRLVDAIREHAGDVDILVIDDNSPDGTGGWCVQRSAADERFHVLQRPSKLGLGTATLDGMRFAIDRDFDQVLFMDADFSHHPRYIPDLLAGMAASDQGPGVDVMIGSRYVSGGGVEGWPWRRRMMSRGVNGFARWWVGLRVHDCSGAFRCFRTAALQRAPLDSVRARGYAFLEEVLWLLQREGARFGETPIVFVDRQYGHSKINLAEAVAALWTLFSLGLRRWGLMK
jgi:dolichol-phosphate mannosyltransferase